MPLHRIAESQVVLPCKKSFYSEIMKQKLLLCALMSLLVFPSIARAQNAPLPPEIEDPQVIGENKQPWHATLMPYAKSTEALKANRRASSFARSLERRLEIQLRAAPRTAAR